MHRQIRHACNIKSMTKRSALFIAIWAGLLLAIEIAVWLFVKINGFGMPTEFKVLAVYFVLPSLLLVTTGGKRIK